VLLPLALLGLGLWEAQRVVEDAASLELQRARAAKAVAILEARPAPPDGRPDFGAQFRRNGRTYAGPIALSEARKALEDAEDAAALARWREYLPPVVMLCGGVTAALSLLALLAGALFGRAGRASRDALLRGFSLVRHVLPPLMGAQVVLVAIGTVAAVAFEASAILEADALSSGGAKLLGIAAVVIGGSLWTAGRAVLQLRRTMGLFTPDPLPVMGRPVTREEAPGLWRLMDDLAGRLGALRPESVVVGLTGGFFVSSGPKVLEPGGVPLAGRTLYLPLPFLALLRPDEVATIIAHELAHFSGGDTEYSLRFLPIYAGVGRSLDAVAMAGAGGDGSVSPLTRPALRLGVFVLDQFHHAVRHWSRLREFAADAAGAQATSADAAARALLRTAAADPRVDETLGAAYRDPGAAPPDLVAASLQHAAARGLDDPSGHLEEAQPHPTDTHPPTRQRLAALGRQPEPALLAEAAAPPAPDALLRLDAYFADPAALCRAATADFLRLARERRLEEHQALQAAAAGVEEAPVALHENTRGGGIFLIAFGALLVAAALFVAAVEVPGVDASGRWVVAGAGGGLGLIFIGFGIPLLRRGDRPFLVLRPDSMLITGLDRPIRWEQVADLDMTMDGGRVLTRILLLPEAPFPARMRGGRRVKLDAKRRIVSFPAAPPRRLKVEGYAELVGRYRQADAARRILEAEQRGAPEIVTEP
jgi:hypothetical protein